MSEPTITTKVTYCAELNETRALGNAEPTAHVTLYRTVATYEWPTDGPASRRRLISEHTDAVDGLTYSHPDASR